VFDSLGDDVAVPANGLSTDLLSWFVCMVILFFSLRTLYVCFLDIRFICLLRDYTRGVYVQKTVLLKITARKGSRIESVPLKKLQSLAADKHRFWSLEGDFLVLHSY
jgi:hypothetical protein